MTSTPTSDARPQKRSQGRHIGREGRHAIVTAATTKFAERGFHGTSMRDIAAEAGITAASIYHHFASKQEILSEILIETHDTVITMLRQSVVDAGDDPRSQLRSLMSAWALYNAQRQSEALIQASEMRSLKEEELSRFIQSRDEVKNLFEEVVRRGMDLGAFHAPYPEKAARAIVDIGYCVSAWDRGMEGTVEEMTEVYSELALATVRSIPD